jgi:crossover junction endodeoxyribonuclease RuvC
MIYIGIDPGKSGAIAIAKGSDWTVIRLNQTEHDIAGQLSQAIGFPSIAVVEKVHSSPQMGVKSAFTFGESFGFLKGLLAAYGIPYTLVTPPVWQKRMGCMTKGDKNVTKQAAQRLMARREDYSRGRRRTTTSRILQGDLWVDSELNTTR